MLTAALTRDFYLSIDGEPNFWRFSSSLIRANGSSATTLRFLSLA